MGKRFVVFLDIFVAALVFAVVYQAIMPRLKAGTEQDGRSDLAELLVVADAARSEPRLDGAACGSGETLRVSATLTLGTTLYDSAFPLPGDDVVSWQMSGNSLSVAFPVKRGQPISLSAGLRQELCAPMQQVPLIVRARGVKLEGGSDQVIPLTSRNAFVAVVRGVGIR